MCIVNNILNAILYDMSTVNSYIVNNISLRRINNTDNEMNNHGDSRALRRMKNSANQRKRRYDPAIREEEQVANTARRRIAREKPGRREAEQGANTAQWRIAREEPGRRDEENGQRLILDHCGA